MKLLLFTQKVDKDDDVLGFVHQWITELASHWELITVVCLYEGAHSLPENVRVLSLGKEKGISKVGYIARFYKYTLGEWGNYDRVFVHMNPEYLVLGGLLWRLGGKKSALWYSHKSVDLKLRIALFFANTVFTTAKQSVRFKSSKLHIMGHGIDVATYSCPTREAHSEPTILSVGRITRIKQCETLIDAADLLHKEHDLAAEVVFAGKPVNDDDRAYESGLKKHVEEKGITGITFTGSIPLEELRARYCQADIVVNMVPTGGMDKAVLEGMAAGALVLSSNVAFVDTFGPYSERLSFTEKNASELAEKIAALWNSADRNEVSSYLLNASKEFDVKVLMGKLSALMQK